MQRVPLMRFSAKWAAEKSFVSSSRSSSRTVKRFFSKSSQSMANPNSPPTPSAKATQQAEKWRATPLEDKTKYLNIAIDCSALKRSSDSSTAARGSSVKSSVQKSKSNDLVLILKSMIEIKGALTVSEFMQRALCHPTHGYYMKKDVFGVQGDFTTAPEISQMFGELVGIWCVATWQQMGMPSHLKIVEMGPGRGSLMSDFLRAAKSFPAFYEALEVHMLEVSPTLRQKQQHTLGATPMDGHGQDQQQQGTQAMQLPENGPKIFWHEDLANVPVGPSLFIAQEFFDAMPVHQFEYTSRGWCERLVDISDEYDDGEDHFRFVLSPGATPATKVYIGRQKVYDPNDPNSVKKAAASMARAPGIVVPDSKPVRTPGVQIGDRIEISPVSLAIAQDVAKRVGQHGGGALIIDYGHNHPSEVSLRGIQKHQFVSVLREPGDVDLSIDVDFYTLAKYATKEQNVSAFGPLGQGDFLKNMGIQQRLTALLENAEDDKTAEELYSAYQRLVEPGQMGSIFKALALVNTSIGKPVGF